MAFCTFGLSAGSIKPRQMVTAGEVSLKVISDTREVVEGYLHNIQSICYPQGF